MHLKFIAVITLLALTRTLTQTVITLAGGGAAGSTDGVGSAARFNGPSAVAADTSGNVFVADTYNHKVRLIYPNRTVITLAGGNSSGTTLGSTNGVGTAALFRNPTGVAVDTSGNVIVAEWGNNKIRLIYPNLTVITLAGGSTTGTTVGSTDGVGTAALFNVPRGVAVDTSGNVIVADLSNHKIRLIYPNRTVITFAGGNSSGTTSGSTNGVGTAALFYFPRGVAVDSSGNVIVADQNNHKIRLIYPNRTVITLAGGTTTGTTGGSINGVGTAALFNGPPGVAVDTSGNVFVADQGNNKIRLIYPFTCSPGTYANFTSRSCTLCPPGSFSATSSATSCPPCAAGTFAQPFGSTSCDVCPGGHFCPLGASKPEACGAGAFCPPGSFFPTSCPPLGYIDVTLGPANGPAFDVDTAACYNHCFFGGDGQTSRC